MKKAFLLFFTLFCLTACSLKAPVDTPFVKIEQAIPVDLTVQKSYQGFIDRGLDVNLSFGLSGVMNDIFVVEGDFVKKGRLLAKLDNDEYKFEISRAKTELDDALVKHNRAKSYYERISKLYKAGGISYNDWESAETDLKTSLNKIKILDDALRIAKNKETFSNIYAPSDGYIIKTYKDKMQFASAGDTVILFQGKGALEARVFVSQNDINSIKIGQKVILRADAIKNKEYIGKIKSKVNSSINEGSYRVTVSFDEDYIDLLDGMSVSVYLENKENNCKILIPTSALVFEDDKKFVYILKKESENKGIVTKREVLVGDFFKNRIEVLSGVKTGEFFVIEGVDKLMDGAKVNYR